MRTDRLARPGRSTASSVRIALVACVKSKRRSPAPARDLYVSPLFRAARRYAETRADRWYVLSAKHHLVPPDEVLAPYELTLKATRAPERAAWADQVERELADVLPANARVTMLAGARYREHLTGFLEGRGVPVDVPLEGLKLGEQLRWLKHANATV